MAEPHPVVQTDTAAFHIISHCDSLASSVTDSSFDGHDHYQCQLSVYKWSLGGGDKRDVFRSLSGETAEDPAMICGFLGA